MDTYDIHERRPVCEHEGLYFLREHEHEGRCSRPAVIQCCGVWWCMGCHEDHLDAAGTDHPDPSCWWCMGTGVIVGHFGHVDQCYWRCRASGLTA